MSCALESGDNAVVRICEETTFRTLETTPTMFKIPFLSESYSAVRGQPANNEIRGNPNAALPFVGNWNLGGNWACTFHFDTIGLLLNGCIGAPTSIAASTVATEVYTGAGVLDDMSSNAGANYTGTDLAQYEIVISTAAGTDKFTYQKTTYDANGQETAGAVSAEISITGAAQAIADGLTVTFGATTGHAVTDSWTVMVYGQNHHVFDIDSDLPSYNWEIDYSGTPDVFNYLGTVFNTLGLTLSGAEGPLAVNMGLLGSKLNTDTSTNASSTTSFTDLAQSLFRSNGLYIDSTLIANFEELTINHTNNFQPVRYVETTAANKGTVSCYKPTIRSTTGMIRFGFEDQDDLLTDAIAETEVSLISSIAAGDYWLRAEMQEVLVEPSVPMVGSNTELIKHEMNYTAGYQNGSYGSQIRFTLFGGAASY